MSNADSITLFLFLPVEKEMGLEGVAGGSSKPWVSGRGLELFGEVAASNLGVLFLKYF